MDRNAFADRTHGERLGRGIGSGGVISRIKGRSITAEGISRYIVE